MDEFELIQHYFVRGDEGADVITGIGDDGAVLQPDTGRELVSVVDAVVGGVHFPVDIDAADLGYRAVAVNLSDIAAMGARPRWMTLSLTIPEANPGWLEGFAAGLHAAAAEYGVALVGGDTTHGNDIVVSIQITGDVARGKAILRSGAQPGDTVFVTGTVGDAAAGLELILRNEPDEHLSGRFLRPAARVAGGQSLAGIASAMIDISDGLYGDLQKLLSASGVGADIDIGALPISNSLRERFTEEEQQRFALSGGDDYELCFTAAKEVPAAIGGVPVTPIGKITQGSDLVLHDNTGIVAYEDSGYLHFQ